jgi:hypothetical protein
MRRELVQKTCYQLDVLEQHGEPYWEPIEALESGVKNWDKMTRGLSHEEMKDFEAAKKDLEKYQDVYKIFQYATELNSCIQILELRITSNNPTIPMNFYRKSNANSIGNLIGELELYMKAYYDLIDQCKDHPDWQKKLQKELGSQVSFLAKQIDEDSHEEIVKLSPIYKRFDDEKQIFFK